MLWLVLALSIPLQAPAASPVLPSAVDVTRLTISAPKPVAELDLGKLKGELRQLAWSPDRTMFYVQTAEGSRQSPKLRHYTVTADGGAIANIAAQPDWANVYWATKSDRAAPGIGSLMIDVEQKMEKVKVGTGSGRPGEMAGGAGNGVPVDIEKTAEGQYQNVVRLTLLDATISEFVNQQVIPGLLFGWGPEQSGAIAFSDADGRLMLLDQQKHQRTVSGAHDAMLPAWSLDGSRLAWVQKSGRKKYALMVSQIGR
jgi:hypothetical protein